MSNAINLFNQTISLCAWLNFNTNISASFLFDGRADSVMVDIQNNNGESLYVHKVDAITKKAEKLVLFEIGQINNILLEHKFKQEETV